MSLHDQCIPPTVNYRDADPECNLDIVQGSSRQMAMRYALSNNIGLGGHNGAIILKRYDA